MGLLISHEKYQNPMGISKFPMEVSKIPWDINILMEKSKSHGKKYSMEIAHIPMGFKDTCIPWEKLPWENLICGMECNMKYSLEKKVNVFLIFPLQMVLAFQLGVSNFTRSLKRTSCYNLLSRLL